MAETKWTPGPWSANQYRVDAHNECVMVAHSIIGDPRQELANAALTAAAPDLYEALEALVTGEPEPLRMDESFSVEFSARLRRSNERMQNARSALCKARGEKPDAR